MKRNEVSANSEYVEMGATCGNCIHICTDSKGSRKPLEGDDILTSLGIGALKEIKKSQMLEDQLAQKLSLRQDLED